MHLQADHRSDDQNDHSEVNKCPHESCLCLDRSPDPWRGTCLFMQLDLHRALPPEYPSEQILPGKAQIDDELCDHPGWDS